MKRINFIPMFAVAAVAAMTTSCKEHTNDLEYGSMAPRIADLTIQSLNPEHSQVRVGDRFVVTAVQQKKGRLLNRTTYKWSNSSSFEQKYTNYTAYDAGNFNPTDTLIATSAGDCKVTFQGEYKTSGSNINSWLHTYGAISSEKLPGNGLVSYSASMSIFKIKAEKTFTILP